MKLLTPIEEFSSAKSRDKMQLECKRCNKIFLRPKNYIQSIIKGRHKNTGDFCSSNCKNLYQTTKEMCSCKLCGKHFFKHKYIIKKTKNNFCSQSCSGKYNSAHKTTGIRRSKLEHWLELQLTTLYPELDIKYNDKNAIKAELDIYFPSLKLAVELNGIFHYEPIFGLEKLADIQKRDSRKIFTCAENSIELIIIDSSNLKYFKPKNAKKYLDIISSFVDERINGTKNGAS